MWKQFDKRSFQLKHFGPSPLELGRRFAAKVQENPGTAFNLNTSDHEECIDEFIEQRRPSHDDPKSASFDQPCDPNFRVNDLNIQMLSRSLYQQLFPMHRPRLNNRSMTYARAELKKHGLPGKLHRVPDVDLKLPKLFKNDVEKHFYELGVRQSGPYRKLVEKLVQAIPQMPERWEFVAGWTKYVAGAEPVAVDFPDEDAIVFDVEVCVKEGENPVLATAVSNSAWYSWVSADLCRETKKLRKNNFYDYTTQELIPLETGPKVKSTSASALSKPKIVVGHHVSYDRVRVKEQYWLSRTGARFLDTMSLHTCICGVTSSQKMMLKAGTAQNESWYGTASLNNSLKEVYKFYTDDELPKEERDIFTSGELNDVRENFQSLVSYCARDVQATHKVLQHLWPLFLNRFPHPVTLAGMLELSTCYLPVNRNWRRYLQDAQDTFDDLNTEAKFLLSKQADKICQLLHEDKYKEDMWMWDQKWSVKKFSLKKEKKLTKKREIELAEECDAEMRAKELLKAPVNYDSEEFDCDRIAQLEKSFALLLETKERLPVVIPHLAGYPEWYRILCDPPKNEDWKPGPNQVTTSLKSIPKLLSLTWNFMPLHHLREHGWCYFAPFQTNIQLPADVASFFPLRSFFEYFLGMQHKCVVFDELIDKPKLSMQLQLELAREWRNNDETYLPFGLIKLRHKDGDELNVGNPLSRDFINKFSDLEISSGNPNVRRIFHINRQMTYWKNNKDRIENQIVVWLRGFELPPQLRSYNLGVILPQVVVSGTLTRRAVESTWMTASNADDEKVGSELRSMIQAPPGYSIVGADVDSQELWIAGLIGDAFLAKEHGCTAFGWMTLSGQKVDGTDMHSMTARTMGISRGDAKVINYARIYGAGMSFTERLLKQFIPGVSDKDASTKVKLMFQTTKGRRWFKLKPHVFPDLETRAHMRASAQRLCELYGMSVEEMFEQPRWSGGSESSMFNSLENIACSAEPRTPFLQARMSKAVEPSARGDTHQLTTRINWVVQSSAVDFLHLMLVCMRWLLDPQTRFCLSFHDEVRYLVPDEQKYEAALALHVTNLLVRSFFVRRVGMHDLPQSVAFFSSVEVDKVLRKDSHSDCISPSNPYGLSNGYKIPFGESLDINEAIKKANGKIGIFECSQNQAIAQPER